MAKKLFQNRHDNTPGHAHELTFSCYRKKQYFNDRAACLVILDEIETARKTFNLDIWAYVIMPNHVHLLFWPRNHSYDIAEIQRVIKGRTSRRYSELLLQQCPERYEAFKVYSRGEMQFRFWQRGGGFDRNLWNNRPIHDSILYIENNPVRNGFMATADRWEWSSGYAGEGSSYTRPVLCRNSVPVMMKR